MPDRPEDAYPFLLLYYAFAIASGISLLLFSLELAECTDMRIIYSVIAALSFTIVVTCIPGLAISEARSIGYSVTRVAGDLYWITKTGVILPLVASISVLIYCIKANKGNDRAKKAWIVLASVIPPIAGVFLSMHLMSRGHEINAAFFLSIGTTIMTGILIYTEDEHRLFKLTSFFHSAPHSENSENKPPAHAAKGCLMDKIFIDDDINLKRIERDFGDLVVREAVVRCEGNQSAAARMLGIDRSTVNRRLKRAELTENSQKSDDGGSLAASD